jgi:hypothetical protein
VITIQGANAAKSASHFYLLTREAAVIYRKKRADPTNGMRIEIGGGRNISLQIGTGEVIRVAEGRDLEIFYQGRKIPATAIESGVWIGFAPQTDAQ